MKLDIRAAKGRQLLAETMAAGWGTGQGGAPHGDYRSERFGANPPMPVVDLNDKAALAVLNACGVPVSLATDADGTSQRESWRRFVWAAWNPLPVCWPRNYPESWKLRSVSTSGDCGRMTWPDAPRHSRDGSGRYGNRKGSGIKRLMAGE